MSTLLLRLCGPQQSWGTQSRFGERDSEREPTKSGVVGLLCAALGKSRNETEWPGELKLAQLAGFRFGVRIDRPGRFATDYHTAGGGTFTNITRYGLKNYGVRKASGATGDTVLSNRAYLADADFLAGLEGDPKILSRILESLIAPCFQLYLGRKAFVPSLPVYLPLSGEWGQPLHPGPLAEALAETPFLTSANAFRLPKRLDVVADADVSEGELRFDVPLDFGRREFTYRTISRSTIPLPEVRVCSWRA